MTWLILLLLYPAFLAIACCLASGPRTPEEEYRDREEQAEILARMRDPARKSGNILT